MTLARIILAAGTVLGLVAPYPGAAQPAPASLTSAPSTGSSTGAPPRTVNDITGVLGAYKPDPQRAAARKALADQPPPGGADGAALSNFYVERRVAARQVGRIAQQLEDL